MTGLRKFYYMDKMKIFYSALAIAFGIFMIIYGERDDSPGGQGLGLLSAIYGITIIFKNKNPRT